MSHPRRDLTLPIAIASVTALLHLLTANGYGYFRDELYYVACSEHLGFGYVDHPPLIGWITWVARSLLGESRLALRLFPALAGAGTVFLTAWMVRELGGGRFAQALGAVATALAPVYVGTFGYLSMNAFDALIWSGAGHVLIRLFRTADPWWWLPFGGLAGIGLQNKVSLLFLGFGLVVGLLVARRWQHFADSRFWLGGLLAFALFSPHLIWQALNGWPTLEFMANATRYKNLPLAPLDFLLSQVEMMNPLAAPVFLAGLGFWLLAKDGRPYRPLGWTFLAVLVLMITQRSKAYYLSPTYTMMFAPGALVFERLANRQGWGWIRPVSLALLVISGAALAPLAKPILPIESYVTYAKRLGQAPSTSERKTVGRLPQFFADRLGWPELATTISEVYRSLSPEDQARACVFGQNYGQAGAVAFFGKRMGLPTALATHNSYYLWGPGECTGEVMIVMDGELERLEQIFESVELATTYTCRDCMPYENDKPIWVCRGMRLPIEKLWPQIKHYD